MSLDIDFQHHFSDKEFNIQASLPSQGVTAVFGRSGSGKSTLLNAVCGLLTPGRGRIVNQGRVLFDSRQGINTPVWKRNVAVVFQEPRLFPHQSVRDNLNYGRPKTGRLKNDHLAELLGIEHLYDRMPHQLSGGEKQRVGIARALLSEPQLLLMDEPLANLDTPRKVEILDYLHNLSREIQIPIIFVTHSLEEVMHLADHMLVLDEGRVVDFGSVEQVWNGNTLALWKSGEHQSTLIKVQVSQRHKQYAMRCMQLGTHELWIPESPVIAQLGDTMRMQINAKDVSLALSASSDSSIRNILPAKVTGITALNEHTDLIELAISADISLRSAVTRWAVEELDIKVGKALFAQVKSASFTQQRLAAH